MSAPATERLVPPSAGPGAGTLTVVVPTYNERDNMAPLIARLDAALTGVPARVLVVDDSDDGTADVVRALAASALVEVNVLHRGPGERIGGLGGAVAVGLRAADSDYVVVLDGDLQHPPEVVPQLLDRALEADADVVVASRYIPGGSREGLAGLGRRLVSQGATGLAKAAFPKRLRGCSDPMSGFFLVRREAVDPDILRPDGFKILLEILGRHRRLRVAEVPFTFGERHAGDSKAHLSQGLVYLRHLARLRIAAGVARFGAFLLVGASGVVPNLLVTALLLRAGVHYALATAAATAVAASWNFVIADTLVFRARRTRRTHHRWLGYLGLGAGDIVVRIPIVALLVEVARMAPLPASVASIVLAGLLRFLVVDRWLYPHPAPAASAGTSAAPAAELTGGPLPLPRSLEAVPDVA
jgi:dolichol-phosphate mannosyltransferase